MAAINVVLNGVIVDLYGRVISGPVKIMGELAYSDRQVGGGPMPPGPGGSPPGIWPNPPEGIAPHPEHPIAPGGPPPGIWPNPPEGIAPLPEHPIVVPPVEPPTGPADDNGFIKPPPEGGGWGFHEVYGWMYDPPSSRPGPK